MGQACGRGGGRRCAVTWALSGESGTVLGACAELHSASRRTRVVRQRGGWCSRCCVGVGVGSCRHSVVGTSGGAASIAGRWIGSGRRGGVGSRRQGADLACSDSGGSSGSSSNCVCNLGDVMPGICAPSCRVHRKLRQRSADTATPGASKQQNEVCV